MAEETQCKVTSYTGMRCEKEAFHADAHCVIRDDGAWAWGWSQPTDVKRPTPPKRERKTGGA